MDQSNDPSHHVGSQRGPHRLWMLLTFLGLLSFGGQAMSQPFVSVGSERGELGQTLFAGLSLNAFGEGVTSFSFDVNYDPALFSATSGCSAMVGDAPLSCAVGSGTVTVSATSPQMNELSGFLGSIQLNIISSTPNISPITISNVSFLDAVGATVNPGTNQSGLLTIVNPLMPVQATLTPMQDPVINGVPAPYQITLDNQTGGSLNNFQSFGAIGYGKGKAAKGYAGGFLDPSPQTSNGFTCTEDPGYYSGFSCVPVGGILPAGVNAFVVTISADAYTFPSNMNLGVDCGGACTPDFPAATASVQVLGTPAQFSFTASADTDPIDPNSAFNYLIDVSNAGGPEQPFSVEISSADAILGDGSDLNWLCTPVSAQAVSCTFQGIPSKDDRRQKGPTAFPFPQLTIPATSPNASGQFSTSVQLIPTNPDTVVSANPLVVNTTGNPLEASLRAGGSAPATALIGSTINYTLQVQNYDDPANPVDGKQSDFVGLDIIVQDPGGLTPLSQFIGFAGANWSCFDGGQRKGSSAADKGSLGLFIRCDYSPTLGFGQTTNAVQVQVQMPNAASTVSAFIAPSGTDYNPTTGDDITLVTQVSNQPNADLSLSKTSTTRTVVGGETLTYDLLVINNGPSDATGLLISDQLPEGVTYNGFSGDDWDCTESAGDISCDFLPVSLPSRSSSELHFDVTAPLTLGPFENVATVFATELDPVDANNTSSFIVTVAALEDVDLLITILSRPDVVAPGDIFAYDINVTNFGPGVATDVVVTTDLPPGVTFLGAAKQFSCADNGNSQVICDFDGQLNPDDSVSVTLDVQAPMTEGMLNAEATVESAQSGPITAETAGTVVQPGGRMADVYIDKTASIEFATEAQPLTYTLSVGNFGPNSADAIQVTDTLPPEFSFQGISAAGWNCNVAGQNVICDLMSELAMGEMTVISIDGSITVGSEPVVNSATVTSDTSDPDSGNNSSTATVSPPAGGSPTDLAISKDDSADPVLTSGSFAYLLTAKNLGPAFASRVRITDELPPQVSVESIDAPGWDCTLSGLNLFCELPALAAGAESVVAVNVIGPDAESTITNVAEISSDAGELDPSNNMDSEDTTFRLTPTEDELREALEDAFADFDDPIIAANIVPISNLCANPIPTVLPFCREIVDALNDGRTDEVAEAIRQTVGQQTISQHTSLVEAASAQFRNIDARLSENRGGGGGFSVAGLNIRYGNETLPLGILQSAAEDDPEIDSMGLIKPWGFFVNGTISSGERDPTTREVGFEFDTLGITAGIDYRPNVRTVVGGAIGWADFDSDFRDGSTLQTDGFMLTGYGSYYPTDTWYVDGRLSWGQLDFDQTRLIRFTIGDLVIDDIAVGNTSSDQFSGAIATGFHMNKDTWNFTPSASLSFMRADIDGFQETGSDLALTYNDQDVESMIATAAISVSKVMSVSRGVITPQFDLAYHHELQNDDNDVSSRIIGAAASSTFMVEADQPDTSYGSAGIGLVFVSANGRQAYLSYRNILGLSGFSRWTVNAGIRFEF